MDIISWLAPGLAGVSGVARWGDLRPFEKFLHK